MNPSAFGELPKSIACKAEREEPMKDFAVGCIVLVVLATGAGALSTQEVSQAAMVGACGFVALLGALCFWMLADIREVLRTGK